MFKELLKARNVYYGKKGFYPTAVEMSQRMWDEIKLEGKSLSMNTSHGFLGKPVPGSHYPEKAVGTTNGLVVFINDDLKTFNFGFWYSDGFNEQVF